ncbi:MAG: TraR/DksA C4-type zinc finger protein [Bdellovibrionota bacterium]
MAVNASELTQKELKELKALLDKKMSDLNEEISLLEAELKEEGASEEQGAPDEFDRSSYEENLQRSQIVLDGKYRLQKEVKAAIERLNKGEFGVCELTEEPIGIKRLRAQPWTRFSIEAQKDVENNRRMRSMTRGSGAGRGEDDNEDSSAED